VKAGAASETAAIVCMACAIAHGRTSVAAFSDPTAMALLSVEQKSGSRTDPARTAPQGLACTVPLRAPDEGVPDVIVARTVAIDSDLRDAAAPQVVILGAGLDGRAWRMRELATSLVFEVDHPDSQQQKLGSLH
jgi:methyltransferase (TIGR00027 family)